MEFISDYISIVALTVALAVGYIVKNFIPGEKVNNFIPLIVAIVGLVICLWDANWIATPQIIATGLVSGLASTGLHEAFKKFIEMSTSPKPVEE